VCACSLLVCAGTCTTCTCVERDRYVHALAWIYQRQHYVFTQPVTNAPAVAWIYQQQHYMFTQPVTNAPAAERATLYTLYSHTLYPAYTITHLLQKGLVLGSACDYIAFNDNGQCWLSAKCTGHTQAMDGLREDSSNTRGIMQCECHHCSLIPPAPPHSLTPVPFPAALSVLQFQRKHRKVMFWGAAADLR
jgi:hypothetical protein